MSKNDESKVSTRVTSRIVKKDENDEVYEVTEREYEQNPDGSMKFLDKEEITDKEEIKEKLKELNQSRRND